MDFFEQQQSQRKQTALILVTFVAALVLVTLAVELVVWLVLSINTHYAGDPGAKPGFLGWLTSVAGLGVATVLLTVMGVPSIRRWRALRWGGGQHVAATMGGTATDIMDSKDHASQRLEQVVEEMAIASGLPCPRIYVLEGETGLNAFAAGNRPDDAAVAVTRGLLDHLERDELQGVAGHEIGHIANGDTVINMRLLAAMAGIAAIGHAAVWMWHETFDNVVDDEIIFDRPSIMPSSWWGLLLITILSGLLLTVGGIGLFIAHVVKASVSRRREYLADASAVQYTRNPDGLAGALLRLQNGPASPKLKARHAGEISHMVFNDLTGNSLSRISSLLATHPPIKERMAALGIKYKQWYRNAERDGANTSETSDTQDTSSSQGGGQPTSSPPAEGAPLPHAGLTDPLSVAALVALAGHLDDSVKKTAGERLAQMPASVRRALRSPEQAVRVIYATLMNGLAREADDLALIPAADQEPTRELRHELRRTFPARDGESIAPDIRLPLVELALQTAQNLGQDHRSLFRETVAALIRADQRVSPFEYAVRTLIVEATDDTPDAGIGMASLCDHRNDIRVVLSLLSHAGQGGESATLEAYQRGVRALGIDLPQEPLARRDCSLAPFTTALERVAGLQPTDKRALIKAARECVVTGERVRPAEAELLRAVAVKLKVALELNG